MSRVKGSNKNLFKHKKIIFLARGYRGRRKNVYIIAKQAVLKSLQYSYVDRKLKRRNLKSFWISRLNYFLKKYNLKYSIFVLFLKKNYLFLNSKILFNLIFFDNNFFLYLIKKNYLLLNNDN